MCDLDKPQKVHRAHRLRRYARASRTTRARSCFGLVAGSLDSAGRCGEGSAETVDDWERIDLHAVMRFYSNNNNIDDYLLVSVYEEEINSRLGRLL